MSVLGITEGSSPALVSIGGRQCALLPCYQIAQKELAARGTALDSKVVHRIARQLGASVLTCRTRERLRWRAGLLPASKELAGNRVPARIDGGRTRLRTVLRKQKGNGKAKTQRRRYQAHGREPKLLILFEIEERGRLKKGTRPWLEGSFAGPDEVLELLAFPLHRLGAAGAEVVTFVADGAPWVWERLDWVERRVGLKAGPAVGVLDWCQAVHNLRLALESLGLREQQRQQHYPQLRGWRRQGWHGLWQRELEELGQAAGNPAGLEQPLNSLCNPAAAGHLDYKRLRRRGLPQGRGASASAIRRVIKLRWKGPGLRWHEENADGALALRAAAVTERWEETMAWVREGLGQDRLIGWAWRSPDMLDQLKAKVPIKPPEPQKAVA